MVDKSLDDWIVSYAKPEKKSADGIMVVQANSRKSAETAARIKLVKKYGDWGKYCSILEVRERSKLHK